LLELAPWLLLGCLIAGLMHVLLPVGWIQRQFRGRWGVAQAVLWGIPLPLCSCGVIPAGIGLKKDGASNGAAIGFLISTPQTGVDSILVSAAFLGWPFALFKVFSALVTGLIGGWLTEFFVANETNDGVVASHQTNQKRNWSEVVTHGIDILRSIWHWLLIGIVIAAAIEIYVPQSFFTQVSQWGAFAAAASALMISLPLYVCATASVPLAATLVYSGLPTGAAIVFLMAGPATNAATVGAIWRTFGWRTISIYLGTIITGSMLCAIAFDWLISSTPLQLPEQQHLHNTWWQIGCALLLIVLLLWFAVDDVRRWLSHDNIPAESSAFEVTEIPVTGMTCNNCVRHVETALYTTPGVESVDVSLPEHLARLTGNFDLQQAKAAVEAAGYSTAIDAKPVQNDLVHPTFQHNQADEP